MTQPENTDPNAPKPADTTSTDAAHTPSSVSGETETSSASGSASGETSASESAASASASADAGDAGGGDEAGDDAGDEAGEGGEGEGAQAGQGTEGGAPAKRKRRRRRKKKSPDGAQAQGEGATAEGATAEGGEGGGTPQQGPQGQQGQRQGKPRRERPERERPAFGVGDVVFGKVIEFTEDALFVDLSGKAKAIFDLRELLITEEEVEEYTRADKKEADEIAAARAASAGGAAAAAAGAGPATATGSSTDVNAASAEGAAEAPEAAPPEPAVAEAVAVEATPAEATPAEPTPAEATPGEATPAEAGAAASGDDANADKNNPQLPNVILEPGAAFVGLVHNDGGRGGLVVLTHHPKRAQKVKPILAEASKSGALVFGLITGTIKGGVEVDVDGLRAFAPASHVELRPGADLSHLVGKRLGFAVTQYAKRGRDVVLSRRAMLESEAKEKREEALKKLEIGGVVEGVVRTVVQFGAFVDVGGVEGLVPLSEMSHNRADQPKDVFKVGETCKVKILRVDEKGKLWLSRRAAIEDPWAQVAQKYAPGSKHTGKVARLQPFGAFIELESGVDGLIHTADLSVKRIEHPEEVVKVGQELEVVVASVDPRQHRIALHPAPTGEAANEAPQRIQPHKIVKVVVVSIESGGLAVRILGATGRNARGFITSAATGTPRGTELRKLFPVGKELEAKILELDPRRGELKLSIKAMHEQTERDAYQQYRAQVKREAKFGTFADLLAKRNVTPNK